MKKTILLITLSLFISQINSQSNKIVTQTIYPSLPVINIPFDAKLLIANFLVHTGFQKLMDNHPDLKKMHPKDERFFLNLILTFISTGYINVLMANCDTDTNTVRTICANALGIFFGRIIGTMDWSSKKDSESIPFPPRVNERPNAPSQPA